MGWIEETLVRSSCMEAQHNLACPAACPRVLDTTILWNEDGENDLPPEVQMAAHDIEEEHSTNEEFRT